MTNLSGANLNNGAAVSPQGEGRESPSRFPAYPAYKDSGVEWLGEVPEHWEVTKLSYVTSRIGSGKTPSGGAATYASSGVPFIRSQNVHDQGLRLDDIVYIDEETDREMAWSRVRPLDVLINITGASIGRSCQVPAEFGRANVNQHVCVIRLDKAVEASDWVAWFMKSPSSKEQVKVSQTGAAREGLNFEQLAGFYLCMSPLNERKVITAFLGHETARINALIAEQQRLIEMLKEKCQALISQAVTKGLDPTVPMKDSGVEWLGEVPAHWDVKKVGHACEIHNNLRTPIDRENRAVRSGVYPYYGPTGVLDYIDDFYVEGEYFLIGEDGDHFLKFEEKPMTFLVEGKFCVNNHAHLVRGKDDCATSWAALCFEARDLFPWLIRQGVGRYKLRKEALVGIFITVPPKSEQLRIVDEINSQKAVINRVISESEQSINLLEERRSALISAAVTGKIDVRGWQPRSAPKPPNQP